MKKYIYILPPVILTLLFGVVYMGFHKEHKAKVEARKQEAVAALEKKRQDITAQTEKAMADQLVLTEKQKKERAEKEVRDQKDFETREAARNARDKARGDLTELEKQEQALIDDIAGLAKEVESIKTEVASVKLDQTHYLALAKETKTQETGLQLQLKKIKDAEEVYQRKLAELAAAAQQQKK